MITEDYPKNFQEFITRFQTEDNCWSYLFAMRWPDGFFCPKCNCSCYSLTKRKLFECNDCGHQTSMTAGTIFQGTRKSLLLWFHIIWWVSVQKTGVSASNFQDFMGFGSYETAWAWLQKLRRVMNRPERDKLTGNVEVDETFIGGEESGKKIDGKNKTGRGSDEKIIVVVATECKGKQIGRVRFKCIDSASSENLMKFIEDNIAYGSNVITDGWSGYSPLSESKDYKHEKKIISGSNMEAHELLPHVHMVDSLLKRWMLGTHQGRVSSKHLEYYLDEYAFRFNRKLSKHRGKIFYRLIQQAVATSPKTLNEIIKNEKERSG
jgi:transposase-like protein